MANGFSWNGPACKAMIERQMKARISAACVDLSNTIKADISQPGTLRYTPTSRKTGKPGKRQKTVYNFTHSRPGAPPFKQAGHLRRSIAWEVSGLTGRVGTNLLYGRYLELGTKRMAARPYILANFLKRRAYLRAIIEGSIKPGGLPPVESDQSRSGVLGAGARKAGYS